MELIYENGFSAFAFFGLRCIAGIRPQVVAGDAAYNGVHQLLAETSPEKRREWIAALDKIESLKPRAVIAGHKRPGNEDSPQIIEETRQYIPCAVDIGARDQGLTAREQVGRALPSVYSNEFKPHGNFARRLEANHETSIGSPKRLRQRASSTTRC